MATQKQLQESAIRKIHKVLNEELDMSSYYWGQLNNIKIDPVYAPKVKFTSGATDTKTHFLSLNATSIPIIIKWLKSIEKKVPKES